MPIKGVGQLLETVFIWSLATARFMMNKSMDQRLELILLLGSVFFKLSSKELTTYLNYKLIINLLHSE